jgi:hypothetical protein
MRQRCPAYQAIRGSCLVTYATRVARRESGSLIMRYNGFFVDRRKCSAVLGPVLVQLTLTDHLADPGQWVVGLSLRGLQLACWSGLSLVRGH